MALIQFDRGKRELWLEWILHGSDMVIALHNVYQFVIIIKSYAFSHNIMVSNFYWLWSYKASIHVLFELDEIFFLPKR